MIFNLMMPQSIWVDPLLSNNFLTPGSHFCSDPEEEEFWLLLLYYQGLIDNPVGTGWSYNDLVSQQRSQRTMDDQYWFQHMAADSGDEAYATEDLYSDCFPATDAIAPYPRSQTATAGVSAVNVGRDFGPSHTQHNKEAAGNDQMSLPNLRIANDYDGDFGASYDPRQYTCQAYDAAKGNQAAGYLNYHDSLPNDHWQPNLPVFGEPLEGPQVSPSSFSSSVPSSATSEAMAAMTLDSMAAHGTVTGSSRANNSGNTWAPGYPSTISPKMLRIHPSPPHTSSPESIHTNLFAGSNSDLGSSSFEHHRTRGPSHSHRSSHKLRKELPTKSARRETAVAKPESQSSSSRGKKSALPLLPPNYSQSPPVIRDTEFKQEDLDDMSYEVETPGYEHSDAGYDHAITHGGRAVKDEFLVRSKRAGMTYREIRRKGNFIEAESTLRGRYRTLTKDKDARVRKPEWLDNDVRLLKKAVRKLNKETTPGKAPWGQVADYIAKNGGSYQFGGATCHRKWKELQEEGRPGMKRE
ncbi:hypothetical protein F4804DRAFT_332497 [Jackrogersella minutella]|nr:hypothetical protein F4804DRAFT_332497 [Jackrogersella minutella]